MLALNRKLSVSRRRLPYCLHWLHKKVVPARKSTSSYERIKIKQVTVLLSKQRAGKRYTLIL